MAGFLDELAKEDKAPAKAAARTNFLDELVDAENPETFWAGMEPSRPLTPQQAESERALIRRTTPQMGADFDVAMAPATPEMEMAANRADGLPDDFPRHNAQESTGEWWKGELGALLRPETWGRAAKLSARNAYEGVTAPAQIAMDAGVGARNLVTGEDYELPSEMHARALDEFLPHAQGGLENVASFGQQALAGALLPNPQVGRPVPEEFVSPNAKPSAPTAPAEKTAQDKLNAAASKQSMGAAGAAVDLQKLSPDLRVAVEKAVHETGGAVNPDVLARQIQADSLPVKVRLSEGQALGDERLISLELNARGKHEAYSKGFKAQNEALVENTRVFRDEAGPQVFTTNATEHADTLIGRYKAIDEAANADISAKYQALRDAAGGDFPIDTSQLLANTRAALKKDLSTNSAPSDVMSFLEERAASGTMSLEDFETLRTTLARIQRSSSDGQARHAAGVIRNQIEAMPLRPEAESLKDLANTARFAARDRFAALEADPAYKAAVNDSVPPDRFVQKFVTGGARDNVEKLAKAMSGDEAATQTVRVATLDHLRQAAGIDAGYNGNFSQAAYNKALQALEPKLGFLLDPKLAEQSRTLGDVARYTLFQPRGSFPNHSNTFTAAAAEKAADALEGIVNYKTGGIPIASEVRKKLNDNKLRKAAEKTFAPGAGLTKLSDLTKIKKEPE